MSHNQYMFPEKELLLKVLKLFLLAWLLTTNIQMPRLLKLGFKGMYLISQQTKKWIGA